MTFGNVSDPIVHNNTRYNVTDTWNVEFPIIHEYGSCTPGTPDWQVKDSELSWYVGIGYTQIKILWLVSFYARLSEYEMVYLTKYGIFVSAPFMANANTVHHFPHLLLFQVEFIRYLEKLLCNTFEQVKIPSK